MTNNDELSAFPKREGNSGCDQGLTKLEYFTAAALTGILASHDPEYAIDYRQIAGNAVWAAEVALQELSQK